MATLISRRESIEPAPVGTRRTRHRHQCVPDPGKLNCSLIVAGTCAAALVSFVQPVFGTECRPHHFRPPYFIKGMGVCDFDLETLSYAGTPVQQAN